MGKFGAIRNVRQEAAVAEAPAALRSVAATVEAPTPISPRGRPAGKRSNPDFEPTTLFLRKATKRTVNRALEDSAAGQDLSELVERLLQEWIFARAKM